MFAVGWRESTELVRMALGT